MERIGRKRKSKCLVDFLDGTFRRFCLLRSIIFKHQSLFISTEKPAYSMDFASSYFQSPVSSIFMYKTPSRSLGFSISPFTSQKTRLRPSFPIKFPCSNITFCLARYFSDFLGAPFFVPRRILYKGLQQTPHPNTSQVSQ